MERDLISSLRMPFASHHLRVFFEGRALVLGYMEKESEAIGEVMRKLLMMSKMRVSIIVAVAEKVLIEGKGGMREPTVRNRRDQHHIDSRPGWCKIRQLLHVDSHFERQNQGLRILILYRFCMIRK